VSGPVSLFVPGTPAPQGSAKAFVIAGKARVTHANKNTMPWRTHVTAVAMEHFPAIGWPRGEAVQMSVIFMMPRRSAEPKTFTPMHTRKPDLDKLQRAILDALTGVAFEDDSQVVEIHAEKRTARIGDQPGVHIYLRTAWNPHPKGGGDAAA
jgi:crossover junction endodeoxyribonuclease RusA